MASLPHQVTDTAAWQKRVSHASSVDVRNFASSLKIVLNMVYAGQL